MDLHRFVHRFQKFSDAQQKETRRDSLTLVKCKDCGQEVSKRAKHCPGCGAPVQYTVSLGTVVMFVVFIVVMAGVVGSFMGGV